MERKEQLKAVIELFMDILSNENVSELKIASEIKKLVVEEPSYPNNTQTTVPNDSLEKLKKVADKTIQIIDKVEEIDKRNSYERIAKKQTDLINNLRNQYSKIVDEFKESEMEINKLDSLEQSITKSNPQIAQNLNSINDIILNTTHTNKKPLNQKIKAQPKTKIKRK